MSATEVEVLAMRSAAGVPVCGRVTQTLAGDLVLQPTATGRNMFAAPGVVLSMALAAGLPAAAQEAKEEPVATVSSPLYGDGFAAPAGARFEVPPGMAVLTGRLLRPDGSPVDSGLIVLQRDGEWSPVYVADDRGRFELHAAPGTYRLAMQTGVDQSREVLGVTLHEGLQIVGSVRMQTGQAELSASYTFTTMGAVAMVVTRWSWQAKLRHPVLYVQSVARRRR